MATETAVSPTGSSTNSPNDPATERERLKETSQKVVDDVKELGSAAVSAAGEAVGDVKTAGSRYADQGKEKLTKYEDAMIEYVRERPMKSLLIAVGAGVVLGLVARR